MSTTDTAKRRTISSSSSKYRTRKITFFEYLCGVKPTRSSKRHFKTQSVQTKTPIHQNISSEVNIPSRLDLSDNIVKRLNNNYTKTNPKIVESKLPRYDANNIVYTPRSDYDTSSKQLSFDETNSITSGNTLKDILDQVMLDNDRLNSPVSSINEPRSVNSNIILPDNVSNSKISPNGFNKTTLKKQKAPSVVLIDDGVYDNVIDKSNDDELISLKGKKLDHYSTLPPGFDGPMNYPEMTHDLYANAQLPQNHRIPDIIIDSGTIRRTPNKSKTFDSMSATDIPVGRGYATLAHESGRRQLMNNNYSYTMNGLGQKTKKPPSSLIMNMSKYQQPTETNPSLYRTSSVDINKYANLPTKRSTSQSSLNKPTNNQNGTNSRIITAPRSNRPNNRYSGDYSQVSSTAF